jgi:hypothetical protein
MLTDGEGNVPPSAQQSVAAALDADPQQRFYIIAFETDEMSDELSAVSRMDPRLDDDGNELGPAAQILTTGTLAEEREFILHKFYTQILADVTGQAFVVDPVNALGPGQSAVLPIGFGEVDYAADIVVCARPTAKYLEMVLISPSGTTFEYKIGQGPIPTGPMRRMESVPGKWKAFHCSLPVKPSENHVGVWKLLVHNRADSADMRYAIMVTAESDFLLDGWTLQAANRPGLPIDVILKPTLFGRPVGLQDPVEVLVTQPNEATTVISLERQPDGTYHGRYRETDLTGSYHFSAIVTARTPQGMELTRERHLTGFIAKQRLRKGKFPPRPRLKPHKHWKSIPIREVLHIG